MGWFSRHSCSGRKRNLGKLPGKVKEIDATLVPPGSERASCLNLAEQWLEMRKMGKGPDMLKEVDMLRKEKSKMENRQAMKVDKPLAFVYLL